jgi:hypothetical protein
LMLGSHRSTSTSTPEPWAALHPPQTPLPIVLPAQPRDASAPALDYIAPALDCIAPALAVPVACTAHCHRLLPTSACITDGAHYRPPAPLDNAASNSTQLTMAGTRNYDFLVGQPFCAALSCTMAVTLPSRRLTLPRSNCFSSATRAWASHAACCGSAKTRSLLPSSPPLASTSRSELSSSTASA